MCLVSERLRLSFRLAVLFILSVETSITHGKYPETRFLAKGYVIRHKDYHSLPADLSSISFENNVKLPAKTCIILINSGF